MSLQKLWPNGRSPKGQISCTAASLTAKEKQVVVGNGRPTNDATKKLRLFDFFGRAFTTTSETSRAAQGDGGSFEDRNPVYGDGSHSDSRRRSESLYLSASLSLSPFCVSFSDRSFSLSPSVYLSFQLSVDASIYMSFLLLI